MSKKPRTSPRARGCLLAAAACAAPALQAQPATATLPETRVTATRFAEDPRSLPLAVSVITADEIRAIGADSVNDAIVRLLGVPARQDLYGGGEYSIDLRGFGSTADVNQVVIVDGVRVSEGDLGGTRLAGIPIDSVERIEVLRGSGAVLYGEGATGGVIVVTTRAGTGRQQANSASVYGAAGSFGLRDARATASVAGGGFALDASAQKRKADGFRDHAASDFDAASVTGQWGNDWLRIGARYGRDTLDAELAGALTAAQYRDDPRQSARPDDKGTLRNERGSLFARAELAGWELGLDLGSRTKKLRSMNGGFAYDYDIDANFQSVRARREASFGSVRNIFVAGVDLHDWERAVLGAFGATARQRTRGYYFKNDVVLPGGTRLSAGARTEGLRKSDSTGNVLDRDQQAWELGASHAFTPAWTAWARLGRSFRLASADEFSYAPPGVLLKPQTSRDAEAGLRYGTAATQVELRVFRSRLTDEIGYDPAGVGPFGPFGANVNFDPTRRQGVELDARHALNAALALRLNLAWREAAFRAGPYAGNELPLVPRKLATLRAEWKPRAGHTVTGGVNWVSSQHPDLANACIMPSYTTADVRYAVRWQRAEFALGVSNLFDRKFYTQAFGCAGDAVTSIYPEPGRAFTASVRVDF